MTRGDIPTVRLVDRKTRQVEVLGPRPVGVKRSRPTDVKLLVDTSSAGPQPVGLCLRADNRRARFVIDAGELGDGLLDVLTRSIKAVSLVRAHGVDGWVVEGDGGDDYTRSAGEVFDAGAVGQILDVEGRPVRR
ncbi:MAG TPA: hypothetical protein VMO52_09145 [Acidimicrobiia bacterium]|nr:hypothetical protein [Acidimicrobiia bacterium]